MPGISKKQIQLIKIAQGQLGIDEDTYREMLVNRFGVRSCTQLSRLQADLLIGELKQRGFVVRKGAGRTAQGARENPPRPPFKKGGRRAGPLPGNVVKIASAAQHGKIEVLRSLVHWRVKDGFSAWLGKRFSIRRVRTAREAWRVIEGLKKMFENQMKAEYGPDWWQLMFENDDVMWYIGEHRRIDD